MDDGIESLNCPKCLHPLEADEVSEGVAAQCTSCGFRSEVVPWAEGEDRTRPPDDSDLADIYYS
jgi:hypothetical protein